MEKCKNCIFWRPDYTNKRGYCSELSNILGVAINPEQSIFVKDQENRAISYLTGPMFGCNHFRDKLGNKPELPEDHCKHQFIKTNRRNGAGILIWKCNYCPKEVTSS